MDDRTASVKVRTGSRLRLDSRVVGGRLRAAREKRGWRQVDVAAVTGMSQSTIARIETGQRRLAFEEAYFLRLIYRISWRQLYSPPKDSADQELEP